jgi:hypothetical protein
MLAHMRVALLLLVNLAGVEAFAPSASHCRRLALQSARHAGVWAQEYSTRVKATAETRAPLLQARLFFLYPAVLAGAGVGTYVSLTRLAAGLSGMRTDLEPLADGGNTLINLGVIATAVFFGRRDLKQKEKILREVAQKLGELPADEPPAVGEADIDT